MAGLEMLLRAKSMVLMAGILDWASGEFGYGLGVRWNFGRRVE